MPPSVCNLVVYVEYNVIIEKNTTNIEKQGTSIIQNYVIISFTFVTNVKESDFWNVHLVLMTTITSVNRLKNRSATVSTAYRCSQYSCCIIQTLTSYWSSLKRQSKRIINLWIVTRTVKCGQYFG